MNTIKVRNIELGAGKPKICIPIVETNLEAILDQARKIVKTKADLVELRVDWIDDLSDDNIKNIIKQLREILKDMPILFTIRTKKEGGEKSFEIKDYLHINKVAMETGLVDLVDVEIFTGDEEVKEMVGYAKENKVFLVGSNHDFDKTPSKEEIISRLNKMQDLGVDIPKIALMPNSPKDVLTVLEATNEFRENFAKGPIITMSMGQLGVVSRLAGRTFGSALTFASLEKASAPGQISVEDLYNILDII